MKKFVYAFGGGKADGDGKMKDVLGGKGSGLAEMSRAGVPVPPGFTISTEVCNIYFQNNNSLPKDIEEEIAQALAHLEEQMGKKLGGADDPLLCSVRSGAKFSMPGMMNTILNLGLNDQTVEGLARKSGNPRFAYDCYRRFIQMFGEVALDMDMHKFDHIFDERKKKTKVKLDTELTADDLKVIIEGYKALVKKETGKPFPQDARTAARHVARRRVPLLVGQERHQLPRAWKRSRTTSAPPPTCRPWSSATWATLRAPELGSRAIRRRAKGFSGASSC